MRHAALFSTIVMTVAAAACTVDGSRGTGFADGEGDATAADATATDGPMTADPDSMGESGEADGESSGGEDVDPPDGPPVEEYIEEARAEFPTYADLHEKVVKRTCSPNGGVCHNEKEYPDLHTPQQMLSQLDVPCNLAETEPLNLFNGCESPGDTLRFVTGNNTTYASRIGYVVKNSDAMGVVLNAVIYLKDPIPNAMAVPGTFESIVIERETGAGMLTVGAIDLAASYAAGMTSLQINGYADLPADAKSLIDTDIQEGDPNRDGVFGSDEDPFRLLLPGDPWKSYLLQRVQGNVPGSPMPLANQPLSSAEIIAMACWIEGAADPGGNEASSSIDYDNCQYAAEFGETPTGSGSKFAENVMPIIGQRCASGGCHGNVAPAADLDLTPAVAYENLMKASTQNPDVARVTPGNPTNSYLMTKLNGNGLMGLQMPLDPTSPSGTSPLSPDEIEIIRTWISYGAPND
jgi:hypothetical protein